MDSGLDVRTIGVEAGIFKGRRSQTTRLAGMTREIADGNGSPGVAISVALQYSVFERSGHRFA